jgi:cytochrome c peroxidase
VFRSNFDWDGRATTLKTQLRGVFSVVGDMGIDAGEAVARLRTDRSYDRPFRRAFGRPVDVDAFMEALVAFQQSLVVSESRFDRFYLGGDSTALSDSEVRGWRLFRSSRLGCSGCHVPLPDPEGSGILVFTDRRFHNLGVGYREGRMEDVGLYGVTLRESDWGRFRTPPLANIGLTGPYMHDGSLATLEDVVDFYAKGGIPNPELDDVIDPIELTKQQRADLVAFLGTLSTSWLADAGAVRTRLLRIP